jgi:hypothetical protein
MVVLRGILSTRNVKGQNSAESRGRYVLRVRDCTQVRHDARGFHMTAGRPLARDVKKRLALFHDMNFRVIGKSINLRGLLHDSAVRMMRKEFISRSLSLQYPFNTCRVFRF